MESELLPDTEKEIPPVPLKTYQWEDLRRAREVGAYPWTHLLKPPLEGEITAEDIIRETTPRRSMSREFSRSRTHSPIDGEAQKILNLDSSPGSCRKHGEEGEDEGVHIPNFSKEVSLDSDGETMAPIINAYVLKRPESQASSHSHLVTAVEIPKNVSPKGILKRRVPEQQYIGVQETREKTKCCHPLVNKIKHLADKTLHKLERNENEKSPLPKRKKNEEVQEIRQLKSSPGAVRRQKFSAIKLGDSDELSKTLSIDTPPPRKKKEHIYEDIEESKKQETEKNIQFSPDVDKNVNKNFEEESKSNSNNANESLLEKKSIASQDPSLVTEDNVSLKPSDLVMEKLHKVDDINKEAVFLDDEMDSEEPNFDELFQNQLDEGRLHTDSPDKGIRPKNDSPNITITELLDDDTEPTGELIVIPIESSPSPSPSPQDNEIKQKDILAKRDWSKPSSDHEYEIIEKPPPNIVYTAPSVDEPPTLAKPDDELSSITSLERKYLQNTSDEDELVENIEGIKKKKNEEILSAEALQKDIEDRFFVNTPSTMSRTECEISTSQVDSSALENLPLKRDSRTKNTDGIDNKIQQRIKEGTGKLKTQAGKLKTKLQSMKKKMPDKPKFKMPERPKISISDRQKFTLSEKRKFSLPDRPRFKKINISEKLSLGDRKKFRFPDRPKFNVPDLPKFKMPDRPRFSFPSLSKKKDYKVENETTESSSDLQNVATVEFDAKTYPRLFNRKKKSKLPKTSSSPTLNRDDTPPPTFTFTRVKKTKAEPSTYMNDSSEQPREYGNVDKESDFDLGKRFETTYDFDKVESEYIGQEEDLPNNNSNAASEPDISPSKQECTHVINEINNDEFFVRPRGISRENIQVREYLSDEIRQAFKIPKNALALMGSDERVDEKHMYANELEADSEFMMEDNEPLSYSAEDLNERDDGYYTFPPVRPSRAKRKKKDSILQSKTLEYVDDSVNASIQFSEVDLDLPEEHVEQQQVNGGSVNDNIENTQDSQLNFIPPTELQSIHEYANDDVIEYPENVLIQSQTLPMPPKRKKKFGKKDAKHSSLNDFQPSQLWDEPQQQQIEDIIVYRTEHEYIIPQAESTVTEQSPVPPRRNRSRSSRGTSLCDDDRTSRGAESLTLDTHIPPSEEIEREIRHESPGYATVDKGSCPPPKGPRRSQSKTPPTQRRKSNSSERKYYTVGSPKNVPDRPPRKKSSTSLMTLNSFLKRSASDVTQYVEIDEFKEVHKDLKSGEIVSKMKDRPLPPPPRPPRVSKRKKKGRKNLENDMTSDAKAEPQAEPGYMKYQNNAEDVVEIEVSTQTDPLPDDIDFELGMDENLDVSMTSSLRDIVDEDPMKAKSFNKFTESPRMSRTASRSEKSFKVSDPKISELSKPNIGRTSPTVILVERRVSSPTRINEREEMLTEASLTVQHIDIDESLIPDVPPLPRLKGGRPNDISQKQNITPTLEEGALERMCETNRDVQLDNLVTQRLQVKDLDVGRLNVSELQASKILVSDIEGMTLQVAELDSKSGHISVSGIDFSQSVIDEIVKKFAEISTSNVLTSHTHGSSELPRPVSREEQTQTDEIAVTEEKQTQPPSPPPRPPHIEDAVSPPQRPPPPDLTPFLYSYLQDITIPPAATAYYNSRSLRDRFFSDFHEPQHHSPPLPTRRAKRKPAAAHTESSSDESRPRPSPRRIPPLAKPHEPSISEAGAQFLRVCQSSISRTLRNMFNSFMAYVSGTEDKRDIQMAMVIFLVLVAGLLMFGLSDSRTIHHHHWEFFNPPDTHK